MPKGKYTSSLDAQRVVVDLVILNPTAEARFKQRARYYEVQGKAMAGIALVFTSRPGAE